MSAIRLAVDALAHRYGARTVLQPMAEVLAGPGTIAITGANGAGKSTLLRILAGLQRPTAGHVTLALAGRSIPPAERRRHVGLASPELEFYEELSARENLRFAAEARGLARPGEAAAAALDRTGLALRADDRVGWYSSGMKQRLRIAFATLHEPEVLLLDEPGGHLDAEGREAVAALVRREGGRRLLVLATNDSGEAALAERRVELDGRGLGDPA